MRIGMVGLGKMGAGMAKRLLRNSQEVVVFDISEEKLAALAGDGAGTAITLEALVAALPAPRTIWVMLPSGEITQNAVDTLRGLLSPGDTVIEGGNSRFTDSLARAEIYRAAGLGYVDVGTSGGIWGLDEGYCLMIGADRDVFERHDEIFAALSADGGYAHVGPVGSGHYTKMIHNGVEYALMQAYAEGFELLTEGHFTLDVPVIAELWRHGSVVRSWLLDLAARALEEDPKLEGHTGYVEDSGEGRWTLDTAVEFGIPTPGIAAALFARFASRRQNTYGNRMLAALRNQFGGHAVRAIEREDHE